MSRNPKSSSRIQPVDPLDRRLAHSDVTGSGTLFVSGTPSDDTIDVRFSSTAVVVDVNGIERTFQRSVVRRIFVGADAGADFVINRTNLRSTLDGGTGDDTIVGGNAQDTIIGGTGENRLDGRSGNLSIDQSAAGPGPFGFSSNFEGDTDFVVFSSVRDFPGREDIVRRRDGIRLLASEGNDTIGGTGGAPVTLDGNGGNDTFSGTDVIDVETGDPAPGSGTTTFDGNDGDDYFDFVVGVNRARVKGGAGDDTIRDFVGISAEYGMIDLGAGRDLQISTGDLTGPATVFMGPGVERLRSTRGTHEVFGNSLNNTIEVISGSETGGIPIVSVYGGQGDDVITDGGNGTMYAHGSDGNDSITGFGGDDTLRGGAGNDTLIGGAGKDKLYGDAGDDLLLGRGGSKDRLDGGAGTDAATADVGPSVIDLVLNVEDVN